MYVALTECAASVYQMMRGIIVVITALLSVFILKRKQYSHHWISIAMIVAGVVLVGFLGINANKKDPGSDPVTTVGGIILLLASQCFISGQLISEEKILHGYNLDPFFLVGIEGFWGLFFFAIALPIFQNVEFNGGKLEDSMLAFQ